MGRQARRAQARAERRQKRGQQQQRSGRNPAAMPSAPGPAEQTRSRGSLLKPRWVMDIISELRKVTWPTRNEVGYLTTVVIIVAMLVGALLGAADLGFGWLIEQTILR